MIRFDVEARLERVEKQILRRETELRPLRHERKNLLALLAKQSIPAPAPPPKRITGPNARV